METVKELKYKIALTDNPKEAREIAATIKARKNQHRRELYQENKAQARQTAQEWQQDQSPKSWGQVAEQVAHLEKLARRYGLIKEFKNEGII